LPPWTEKKIDSCSRENTIATYGSGYLLYVLDKTLMAQAFDPERGNSRGSSPSWERIASDWVGFFDVSENGVLIYQSGDSQERNESPGLTAPVKS
jgi:hypothetical protein